MSIRDTILAASDLPVEMIDVAEWGCAVGLRSMTAFEKDAWQLGLRRTIDAGDVLPENFRAEFLVRVMVDADGSRLFADDEAELLGAKSSAVIERLFADAQRINGITREEIDELKKTSGETTSGDSGSDSPDILETL